MSAGADPVRVYWFWRRTLLDPNTDPDRMLAASETLRMLERWYPSVVRSAPPKDEGTGGDLSNPWDFLSTNPYPWAISNESRSQFYGKPIVPEAGRAAWCFSPEIPGRYVGILGAAGPLVCVYVLDDPRLKPSHNPSGQPELHFWVNIATLHAPQSYQTMPSVEIERTKEETARDPFAYQRRPW